MLICPKCPIGATAIYLVVSLQYQSNSAASRASLPCFPSPIAARTGTNFIRLMANYGDEARWGGLPLQPISFQRLPVPPTPPRAPFPGDICGLSPLAGPVSGLWLVHEEALAQAGGAAWFRPRNRFFFPFLSFFSLSLSFRFLLLLLLLSVVSSSSCFNSCHSLSGQAICAIAFHSHHFLPTPFQLQSSRPTSSLILTTIF